MVYIGVIIYNMTSVSLGLALVSEKNSAVLKNYNLEEHTEMKKVLAFLLALSMCNR